MNQPAQASTAIPADQIGTLTPSQVLTDARAAGARPEHVLDAAAVAIAAVMQPVTGIDFHELLPEIATDVRESAHGWVDETLDIGADEDGFTYGDLGENNLSGMLDHVAQLVRQYDEYAR